MSGAAPGPAFQVSKTITKAELQADFEKATKSVLTGGASKTYTKRVALLMHFQTNDIKGIDTMENELAKTFRQYYGIETRQIVLSNVNPRNGLTTALVDLAQHGYADKDCLIILVFSGHGMSEADPAHPISSHQAAPYKLNLYGAIRFYQGANAQPPRPLTQALDWVATTSFLDGFPCEVLHILDCIAAVKAMKAMAEILAAGTETVSAEIENCFTKALIEELKRSSSTSFPVSALYSDIRSNRLLHGLAHMPFYNKPLGSTSIVLRNQAIPVKIHSAPKNGSRILLTAHLDRTVDQNAIKAIKEWLLTMVPNQVKDLEIKLEGAWDSTSSILLFSFPVATWTQLDPSKTAYSYVGEARSGNKLLAPSVQANVLATRPAAGPENKKPTGQFTV